MTTCSKRFTTELMPCPDRCFGHKKSQKKEFKSLRICSNNANFLTHLRKRPSKFEFASGGLQFCLSVEAFANRKIKPKVLQQLQNSHSKLKKAFVF